MISVAYAAETAEAAGHAHSMFGEAEFWVAVAFVIFFVLVGKKIGAAIGGMLDKHTAAVKAEIEEASTLREEAQAMLTEFRRKQAEATREAEGIVTHAREEVARAQAQAKAQLDAALARRRDQALEKIARAEAEAVREVRELAVQIAVAATRRILAEDVANLQATALINQSIAELPQRLH